MGAEINQDWEAGWEAGLDRAISVLSWANEIEQPMEDVIRALQEIQNE